ncbi:MAG: ankyrin repeat domain-containing protein [Planctomycetota bacterium]|nr:ankyrin repeat domain-containing protein [Planctomycetota bacterium]
MRPLLLLTVALLLPAGRVHASEALHDAVKDGAAKTVAILIEYGADPNATDAKGWTPLHHAAYLGHRDVVLVLLRTKAEVDATEPATGATALHFAAVKGRRQVVQALLIGGADPKAKDGRGRTPLDLAAGDGEIVKLLQNAPKISKKPSPKSASQKDGPPPSARYVDWARWAWERARTQAEESPELVLPNLLWGISKGEGERGVLLAELTLRELPSVPRAPLLAGLRDEDARVRGFCVRALGRHPPQNAEQQTLILVAAAKDPLAWNAVGEWAGKDERALKLMATALASPDLEMRVQTARALSRIGRVKAPKGPPTYWAKKVGAALYKNAKHKNGRVNTSARVALSARRGVTGTSPVLPAGVQYWPHKGRPTAGSPVARALAWLASQQSKTGSWDKVPLVPGGAPYSDAVTGLALLCFLHANYSDYGTPEENPYAENVRRGLFHLMGRQRTNGAIGAYGERDSSTSTYAHAMATVALCEGYALTGNALYRPPAQKAIKVIEDARNPFMAWRYGRKPGDNSTSVTVWMVMALKSAQLAELEVDRQALEGGRIWAEKMTDPEFGVVGYNMPGGRSLRLEGLNDKFPAQLTGAMTAAGLIIRTWAGEDYRANVQLRKGAKYCMQLMPSWSKSDGTIDMYYWYLGSVAMAHVGGAMLKTWRKHAVPEFQRGQRKDGSWDPVGAWGSAGGRVYSTALMTGALQVLGD